MNRIVEIWFPGANADAKIQILPASEKYKTNWVYVECWNESAETIIMELLKAIEAELHGLGIEAKIELTRRGY